MPCSPSPRRMPDRNMLGRYRAPLAVLMAALLLGSAPPVQAAAPATPQAAPANQPPPEAASGYTALTAPVLLIGDAAAADAPPDAPPGRPSAVAGRTAPMPPQQELFERHLLTWAGRMTEAPVIRLGHAAQGDDASPHALTAQRLLLPAAAGATRRVALLQIETGRSTGTLPAQAHAIPRPTGHVNEETLDTLARWLAESRASGDIVLVAGRHPWRLLDDATRQRLAEQMAALEHPLIYLSAQGPSGYWAQHRAAGRPLLELNLGSLTAWPIALRRMHVEQEPASGRLRIVAEPMPARGKPVRDDDALLQAWQAWVCEPTGMMTEALFDEDADLVRRQRAELAQALSVGRSQLAEEHLLQTLVQAHADLGHEAGGAQGLPDFCDGRGVVECMVALQIEVQTLDERSASAAGPRDDAAYRAIRERKASLAQAARRQLDQLDSPRAQAYMACRSVQAAKADFDLQQTERQALPALSAPGARPTLPPARPEFYRAAASVGMD